MTIRRNRVGAVADIGGMNDPERETFENPVIPFEHFVHRVGELELHVVAEGSEPRAWWEDDHGALVWVEVGRA